VPMPGSSHELSQTAAGRALKCAPVRPRQSRVLASQWLVKVVGGSVIGGSVA